MVRPAPRSAARLIASAVGRTLGSSGSSIIDSSSAVAEDRRQHVVEIVRDAAGQAADCIHLLRLAQLIFEREPRGDIARDGLHADRRAVLFDNLHALAEPELAAVLRNRRKLEVHQAGVLRALPRVELGRALAVVFANQREEVPAEQLLLGDTSSAAYAVGLTKVKRPSRSQL